MSDTSLEVDYTRIQYNILAKVSSTLGAGLYVRLSAQFALCARTFCVFVCLINGRLVGRV